MQFMLFYCSHCDGEYKDGDGLWQKCNHTITNLYLIKKYQCKCGREGSVCQIEMPV